jgi:hypothetical protein
MAQLDYRPQTLLESVGAKAHNDPGLKLTSQDNKL